MFPVGSAFSIGEFAMVPAASFSCQPSQHPTAPVNWPTQRTRMTTSPRSPALAAVAPVGRDPRRHHHARSRERSSGEDEAEELAPIATVHFQHRRRVHGPSCIGARRGRGFGRQTRGLLPGSREAERVMTAKAHRCGAPAPSCGGHAVRKTEGR